MVNKNLYNYMKGARVRLFVSKLNTNDEYRFEKYLDTNDTLNLTKSIDGYDTLEFQIINTERATLDFPAGTEVKVILEDPVVKQGALAQNIVFAGILYEINSYPSKQNYKPQLRIICKAEGYKTVLARRVTKFYIDPNNPPKLRDVVTNAINNLLKDEGFKLGVFQSTTEVSLAPDYSFAIGTVLDFFDSLATVTGYNWYINTDKTIDFLEKEKTNIDVSNYYPIKEKFYEIISSRKHLYDYCNKYYLQGDDKQYMVQELGEIQRMKNIYGTGVYAKINSISKSLTDTEGYKTAALMLNKLCYESQTFVIKTYFYIGVGWKLKIYWQLNDYPVVVTNVNIRMLGKVIIYESTCEYIPQSPKREIKVNRGLQYKFNKFVSVDKNNKKVTDYSQNKKILAVAETIEFKLTAPDEPIFHFSAVVSLEANRSTTVILYVDGSTRATLPVRNPSDKSTMIVPISTTFANTNLNAGKHTFTVRLQDSTGAIMQDTVLTVETERLFNEKDLSPPARIDRANLVDIEEEMSKSNITISEMEYFKNEDGSIIGG